MTAFSTVQRQLHNKKIINYNPLGYRLKTLQTYILLDIGLKCLNCTIHYIHCQWIQMLVFSCDS